MIDVSGLSKTFGRGASAVHAVDEVSFRVVPGEIYGLLGPNGAGKTTTLRCIATLLEPSRGTITVAGHNTVQEPRSVRDAIGFLTGDMKLSGNLTVRETLRFFGRLNRLSARYIDERIATLSAYLKMDDFLDRAIRKLSTGMTQKASIAVSLVHDPEIIVFDEPTSGLDILSAKTVVDFLFDFREAGKTIIVSTHIMSEAEKLCDRLGIMLEGSLVDEGSQRELCRRHGTGRLEEAFFALARERGVYAVS